ncbi:hypothetical protein [Paraburkholderia phosphatilytica]|uniref:hypothetical protein n=1 Tax=Paraburkholderia phosphatilytica TaxID=2282883 RepID=UPI000E4CB8AB|nr:hypothetical protein [Paraburkholderia phosphatilytica]
MKRAFQRTVSTLAFIAASIVGGWWLGKFISMFSFEMPIWLAIAIKAVMHLAGATDPIDPDDIELLGLFGLFLACCIVVAVVLAIALAAVRRYLKRRRAR